MKKNKMYLKAPEMPESFTGKEKWLSGEAAGSWFLMETTKEAMRYQIIRYCPKGHIECEGVFITNSKIDLSRDYEFTFPSHCAEVTILQSEKRIVLRRED